MMSGELVAVPFRAMHNWKKWAGEDPCVLAKGMKQWFMMEPGQVVHVFSLDAHAGDRHYCDVQIEIVTPERRRQVYLMTLITKQYAREQDAMAFEFGEPSGLDLGVPMKHLGDPFQNPTIQWPRLLDEVEVVKAVEAWKERYWPDWKATLVWGELHDVSHVLEGPTMGALSPALREGVTHCDVLLQCDARLLDDVKAWAATYGVLGVQVVGEFLISITMLPAVALDRLEDALPDIPYIAVPTP